MCVVICVENFFGFMRFIWFLLVCDCYGCKDYIFLVVQGDVLVDFDVFCEIFGDIQSDWYRLELIICKMYVFNNIVVVFF